MWGCSQLWRMLNYMNKLEELFAELYTEPESPQILGSILQDDVILKEEEVEPCQKIIFQI